MPEEKRLVLLYSAVILILVMSDIALSAPDEAYGVVDKIFDGSIRNQLQRIGETLI